MEKLNDEKLMERLERGGFKMIVEEIRKNNNLSSFSLSDSYDLIIGSSLVDYSNGITLEKRYSGIVASFFYYGAGGCYINREWLENASGEELHSLDEDLEEISRWGNYPLLSDDDYSRLQWDMIENCLDEWYPDFTDEEREAARDYLCGCSFYADMIDFSESDLLKYVKKAV